MCASCHHEPATWTDPTGIPLCDECFDEHLRERER